MTSSPTPAVLPDARARLEMFAKNPENWRHIYNLAVSPDPAKDLARDVAALLATPPASDAAVPAGSPSIDPRGVQCFTCGKWVESTSGGHCITCIRSYRVAADPGATVPAGRDMVRHLLDALNDSEELMSGDVVLTAEHAKRLNADVDAWEAAEPLSPEDAWDVLVNVDDRTSPEEYPDMCLITRDELFDFMQRAAAPKVASDTGAGERFTQPLVSRDGDTVYVSFDAPDDEIQPFILDIEHATAFRDQLVAALATPTDATDRATGGGEVAIKPLHWHEPSPSVSYPNWTARNFHTQFEARIDTSKALKWGKFPLSINGNMVDVKFDTVEQAKAYAQAEYETRMRQLLSDVLATTPGGDLLQQAAREEAGEALAAADYLISLYERLWKGGVVRDLAEAIGSYDTLKRRALKPAGDGGEA
jgi:hypothetical protein